MDLKATEAPGSLADGFDLRALPADFYADPFRYYDALREQAPVKRMPDGSYFLTRYRDCEAVYKDQARFTSDKREEFRPKFGDTLVYQHHTTSLVFNDPPLHGKVRKLIVGALSPRAIAQMEAGLRRLVASLLDRMAEKEARGETVDLIADFAAAIPVEVIGNLLDIPQAEREPLRGWSLKILGALEPVITPEQLAAADDAVREFLAFLETLVAERKRKPGDPQTDVLTRLHARRSQWRNAHAYRIAAELHFHSQRRPRDHDQSDRQQPGDAGALAGRESAAYCRSVADQIGDRGSAAL